MLSKLLLTHLAGKPSRARRKLVIAFLCYLLLGAVTVWTLDGFLRVALLCYLAVLALKSIIHVDEDMPD